MEEVRRSYKWRKVLSLSDDSNKRWQLNSELNRFGQSPREFFLKAGSFCFVPVAFGCAIYFFVEETYHWPSLGAEKFSLVLALLKSAYLVVMFGYAVY